MTEQQVIQAILEAQVTKDSGPTFMTADEMADIMNLHPCTIKRYLKKLKRRGRLECGLKRVERLDGYFMSVPAYRILDEP